VGSEKTWPKQPRFVAPLYHFVTYDPNETIFLKPACLFYFPQHVIKRNTNLINTLEREIKTCEMLSHHPHPNICGYKGIVVDEYDIITGLCFEKFVMGFDEFVAAGWSFDADPALQDIECGIDHLHSLDLVHCDIEPRNVFINIKKQRFVVGDFDSTHHIGDRLHLWRGTKG
ncbi:hypothetical protein BCR34DRAFT_434428, partial [Clohesyomyces aquaticus]